MFFATIVEVHGSFVPFAALRVYALVRLVQRPGDGLAVIARLAIGVAYLAHPTGVLLIAQLPLVAMLVRRGSESEADAPRVRLLRHGALVDLGSGLVVSTAPFFLEALDRGVAPSFPLRTLFATPGIATDPQLWTENSCGELFIPYAPLVLTSLIALFLPATRRAAAWLWFAIVPYMIVSQLLILHGGEHGAYRADLPGWRLLLGDYRKTGQQPDSAEREVSERPHRQHERARVSQTPQFGDIMCSLPPEPCGSTTSRHTPPRRAPRRPRASTRHPNRARCRRRLP